MPKFSRVLIIAVVAFGLCSCKQEPMDRQAPVQAAGEEISQSDSLVRDVISETIKELESTGVIR